MNATKTKRLTRNEAVQYLHDEWGVRRTVKTLANLAVSGDGPAYAKDGHRALYTPSSLDAWAASVLTPQVTSSAELKALERAAA